MKIRAKVSTHVRHPNPFSRRLRAKQRLARLTARVASQTDIRVHLHTKRFRLISKHYVASPTDRIDQWQLQTRHGSLSVSRAADGWEDTPFVLYTKGRLIVGKYALHVDTD